MGGVIVFIQRAALISAIVVATAVSTLAADWDRGVVTSVPGQSGQPGSSHYDDLLPLWAEGKYFPLTYSRGKVDQVTRHRLQLKP